MRFMFREIGCPFAHVERVIAPSKRDGSGSTGGIIESLESDIDDADQIGFGNVVVAFFVPQPTKNIALAIKKDLRAAWQFEGSVLELVLLVGVIRYADISVSSSKDMRLQKQVNSTR